MGLLTWLFGGRDPSLDAEEWRQRQLADRISTQPVIPKIDGEADFDFDVVGEGRYQSNLLMIAGQKTEEGVEVDCEATLWREPNNPHDNNAIRVDIAKRTVGYIPRQDALHIAAMMDKNGLSAVRVDALIVGGWKRAHSEGSFGVKLDLPYQQEI